MQPTATVLVYSDNAEWFFKTVREGDIVEVVNSYGDMMDTFGNGFGDWNLSWDKWRNGSALVPGSEASNGNVTPVTARLRPRV